GERQALGQVYFHYVEEVARLVRFGFVIEARSLRIPGAPDIETEQELVQEVFVRAFSESARLSYDGIRPYRPYLLRIAKNLLIDRQRNKGQMISFDENQEEPLSLGADSSAPPPTPSGGTEETLHWQKLSTATSDYVASLNSELREFIRLRFDDERSQQEV